MSSILALQSAITSHPPPLVVLDGKAGSPKAGLDHHQLVTFLKVTRVDGYLPYVHADKPKDFLRLDDYIYHHRHHRAALDTADSPSHL